MQYMLVAPMNRVTHLACIPYLAFMQIMNIIGLTAAFLTTTAFFPQVIKTVRTKSTGDLSLPMYSLMFAGTVSWLVYGLMKGDLPVTLANAISSLASFVIFYYKIKEVRVAKRK
jgi:MtN3 and saliva related transmembrane protein